MGDHRTVIVDILTRSVFGKYKRRVVAPQARRLTTKNTASIKGYIKYVSTQCRQHKLQERFNNLASQAQEGTFTPADVVGTLPDGYVRTNPLPQVPTKQSVPTSRICLPPYFGLPIVIPTLCRIVGPAIARARIPW